MSCPHCKGDGCDPCDYSTLIVADCPACLGTGKLTEEEHQAFERGLLEKLTWDVWAKQLSQLRSQSLTP